MNFYDIYIRYKELKWEDFFNGFSEQDCLISFGSRCLSIEQFAALLSPCSERRLEEMAQKAHDITIRQFGRTIQLYTPMYLSNYCDNQCLYCGFNFENKFKRKKLTLKEAEAEAECIAATGLKHILILTGESRSESPVSYIEDCVKVLKRYFTSISMEVYPLAEDEYARLAANGIDGLTIYQETYDEDVYKRMHIKGPKLDYCFRLDAPERGARAGMRSVNIGALLGLGDWRREAFAVGLHAMYLQDRYPDIEIGVSLPRIRPEVSGFSAPQAVSDKNLVQMITALRIFLPRAGINLSTREAPELRERLMGLGVTRMSAWSTTNVGGHTLPQFSENGAAQFEISDKRDVDGIRKMIERRGYQPVLKDWMRI